MENNDIGSRIKVCFFLGGLTNGGIGRVTSILVNEMVKNSEYELFVLGYSRIKKEDYEIDSNIHKSYLLNEKTNMTKAILCGAIKKLRKYLADNAIDILVSCGVILSFLSISSCKGLKTKCISWEHSSMFIGNKDFRMQAIIRRYAAKKSNLNVVLTNKTRDDYIKKYNIAEKRIVRIYNPVDPLVYRSNSYDSSSKYIISVGRLSYQKKIEDVIKAGVKVFADYGDWEWHIYGDGEEKEKLQSLIEENNLQNNIFLKGRVSNIYDLYGKYAFIVMTSRYEGFPMTLLEAAGNRLPMISYDIDTGPSEIIRDGDNGYLIEADNIDELTKKIEDLIDNDKTRKSMSESSFNTALKFQLQEIVDEWDKIFKGMMK